MVIGDYSTNGYWWLFHCKLLMIILLMSIDGYFLNGCWWLLYYKLFFVIIYYITIIGDYYIVGYFKSFFIGYYFIF
jgi:hypothetical protein